MRAQLAQVRRARASNVAGFSHNQGLAANRAFAFLASVLTYNSLVFHYNLQYHAKGFGALAFARTLACI